jgi:hypothetical protein
MVTAAHSGLAPARRDSDRVVLPLPGKLDLLMDSELMDHLEKEYLQLKAEGVPLGLNTRVPA